MEKQTKTAIESKISRIIYAAKAALSISLKIVECVDRLVFSLVQLNNQAIKGGKEDGNSEENV